MITVCIVDDRKLILDTLTEIIRPSLQVAVVGVFQNAEDFIEAYASLLPDITIMDIDLPGISGIDAILTIKSAYPNAKFLVLSVFNDSEKVFKAIRAGAGGYLLKKDSYASLLTHIEELHDGSAPMSPEIAKKVLSFFQGTSNAIDMFKLTTKEKIVLDLIVDGFLYKEIADKQGVTIYAIKKHAHNIYEKMQVRTRSEAIKKYLS